MSNILKESELVDKIQDQLNSNSSVYDYHLFTEITDIENLPKEMLGYADKDNTILGIVRANNGYYQPIDRTVYNIDLSATFFIIKDQFEPIYAELAQYVQDGNGKVYNFGSTDYSYITTMQIVQTDNVVQLQGSYRIPVEVNISYVVVENIQLTNNVSVAIDNIPIPLNSYTFTKVKAVTTGVPMPTSINDETLSSGYIKSQTFTFTLTCYYIKALAFIVAELLDKTGLEYIHKLDYSDTNGETFSDSTIFDSISKSGNAGSVEYLTVSGSISRKKLS